MSQAENGVLSAPLLIEYPFLRTTGPVMGAFFTGLKEGRFLGIRAADGRVLCPPVEYDPVTADPLTELVEVGATGTVVSWTWVVEPRAGQPLDRPFAWALIRLDGADTPMLQAVDAGDPAVMSTGMRVAARWAEERQGLLGDISCFEPAPGAPDEPTTDGEA